ncbi:hypothetical protein [Microbulbifer harenosus]|uniref:Uncharacterized protein n=1 Tax=Microbulbifer harenosus TaxID=2576840 RepID=A0ABY2UIQ0_9GAMM|nr:hypothetical protein [Microbulbifer harenosus]TLM77026.1 hypothetical protein FDY93_11755 [Microbulbifer harenosus]
MAALLPLVFSGTRREYIPVGSSASDPAASTRRLRPISRKVPEKTSGTRAFASKHCCFERIKPAITGISGKKTASGKAGQIPGDVDMNPHSLNPLKFGTDHVRKI